MRKDFKKGLFIGAGLCLAGLVWFCAVQRISSSPSPKPSRDIKVNIQEQAPPPAIVFKPQSKIVSPPATKKLIIHTVKPGQTLSDISKIYYNTTQNWRKIYEANKQKFPKGPDAIKTGIKLVIPQ